MIPNSKTNNSKRKSSWTVKLFCLLISIHWLVDANGQPTNSYTGKIAMPSAEAASLGKYTDVPIGKFSGVPDIEIPIHTVKDGDLMLAISLSYHASGHVATQVSSRVGADWTLSAGGMISRTVLGIRDEGDNGYYYNGQNVPLPADCNYNEWVVNASNGNTAYETEPDIFSYNIGGNTGKFYFNLDSGTPILTMIPRSDVKIVPHFQGSRNQVDHLDYFTIIGVDGTKYYLGNYDGRIGAEQAQFSGTQNPVITAWYVVKVESSDGLYSINLDYANDDYEYEFQLPKNTFTCVNAPMYDFSSFKSRKLISISSKTETVNFVDGIDKLDVRPHYQTPGITPKSLGSIIINTGGFSKKFVLNQSHWIDNENPQSTSHLNYLLRLDSIQEMSTDNTIVKPSTSFEYQSKTGNINFFPNRLTKAIDHWGYYNGQTSNNTNVNMLNIPHHDPIPCQNGATCGPLNLPNGSFNGLRETDEAFMKIGTLKKIFFPLGGSIEYKMEANDFYTSELQTTHTELIRVDHAYPYPGNCNTTSTPYNTPSSYAFTTMTDVKYTYNIIPALACPMAPTLAMEIILRDATTNAQLASTGVINFSPGMPGSSTNTLVSLFPAIPLNTPVKFEIIGINCAAQFKVFSETTQPISLNKKVGGLRIKSIIQKHIEGVNEEVVINYEYRKSNNPGQSSAILFYKPKYWFTNTWVTDYSLPCAPSYPNCGMCSNGIQDGGENGIDCGGNCSTPCGLGAGCHTIFTEVPVVPLSSFEGYHIGYEQVSKQHVDGSKTWYEYFVEAPFVNTGTYLEDDKYPIEPHQARINTGQMKKETRLNNLDEIINLREHFTYLTDSYNLSSDRMMKVNRYNTSCMGNGTGFWMANSYHIRTKAYREERIENTIDGVLSSQVFSYDPSNRFLMPVSQTTTNSDGKQIATNFTYIHDYPNTSLRNFLLDKNIIMSPFKVSKMINGVQVDGSETEYNWYPLSGGGITSYSSTTFARSFREYRYEATWNAVGTLQAAGKQLAKTNLAYSSYGLPSITQEPSWSTYIYTWSPAGLLLQAAFGTQTQTNTYHPGTRLLDTYTSIDGLQFVNQYDQLGRKTLFSRQPINVNTNLYYHYPNIPSQKASIKTRTTYPPATDSALDSIVHINYVDGLGRPIQDIHKYGAPDGADVITKTEYDAVGRPTKTYEPISANGNNGVYYTGSFGGGYTEQLYHTDPLDRPKQVTPPAWQSTNTTYGTNPSALTNPEGTVYAAGSLHITTTTDPDSKHTDVYTDKLGQVVLVRRRQAANTADTWTIYDDKQREVKIYPPGSSPATPDLIHEKRYDGDDNVIYLKKPDATAEEYRYSARNLQIAMRNGVLAAQGRWLVTHYDVYGRPIKRGYYTGSDPGTTENPTIATLLEEYFYDGYNGSTTNTAAIYKGKLKKKRIKALEDNGANGVWTETEYTYDTYGRIGTETIVNHLGSTETKTYTYDFGDNMTSETCVLTGVNGVTHVNKHSYDAQGRKIMDKVSVNGGTEVTTAQTNYNHKSLMVERNLGRFATTGTHQYLQSLDYTYNPQGWLTSINTLFNGYLPNFDPCDTGLSSGTTTTGTTSANTDDYDLFALELGYNTALGGSGITASQNGNITSVIWRHPGQYNQSYSCKYDFLNRLTDARHGEIVAGVHTLRHQYTEKLGYDQRGNILQLSRRGMVQRPHIADACYQPATIDSLTYIYPVGSNKLVQVVDNAPCPDVVTLPAEITRDIHYAASQQIHVNKSTVACNVNMKLTAGQQIIIQDSLYLPSSCGVPAYVHTYQGPCPPDKYTEGFNQQSATGQYTYDNSGNLGYDPNKKVTYYYNYLNLQHKIIGAEGDTLFNLYSADGTLLQRKYKVGTNIKYKKDYLDNKELSNDVIESIYHNDGRVVKDGSVFKYEYWIKDHLGNVRVTFSDDNGNGLLVSDEIRSRNDYYTFGMEMNSRWKLAETYPLLSQYKFNGSEFVKDMNLNQGIFFARNYDPVLGRWWVPDPLSHFAPDWTPYRFGFNNPLIYTDPFGLFESKEEAKKYAKEHGINTGWFSSSKIVGNKDGSWSIDNKKQGSSISNIKDFGIIEGSLITDYKRNNTDVAKYGGIDSYRAWQSNPNYNEGETKWDRVFRLMGNSHNEIAHDFGSGGYNMFGGYGRAVSSTGGGRVFWSGEGAMNKAMNYAKSTGGTTLEMTRAGQNLQNLIKSKNIPWSEAKPMWVRLSSVYARGANGTVHFFPGSKINPGSIWLNTEKNILLKNGVNIITH